MKITEFMQKYYAEFKPEETEYKMRKIGRFRSGLIDTFIRGVENKEQIKVLRQLEAEMVEVVEDDIKTLKHTLDCCVKGGENYLFAKAILLQKELLLDELTLLDGIADQKSEIENLIKEHNEVDYKEEIAEFSKRLYEIEVIRMADFFGELNSKGELQERESTSRVGVPDNVIFLKVPIAPDRLEEEELEQSKIRMDERNLLRAKVIDNISWNRLKLTRESEICCLKHGMADSCLRKFDFEVEQSGINNFRYEVPE